jgi:hypothetical protein
MKSSLSSLQHIFTSYTFILYHQSTLYLCLSPLRMFTSLALCRSNRSTPWMSSLRFSPLQFQLLDKSVVPISFFLHTPSLHPFHAALIHCTPPPPF